MSLKEPGKCSLSQLLSNLKHWKETPNFFFDFHFARTCSSTVITWIRHTYGQNNGKILLEAKLFDFFFVASIITIVKFNQIFNNINSNYNRIIFVSNCFQLFDCFVFKLFYSFYSFFLEFLLDT